MPLSERTIGPGWTVEHVAETGSTNADLLATAAQRPDRSVLVAAHQTAGRGRLDRRWDAPPGANLLVSILFHDVPAQPSELTRRVALAAGRRVPPTSSASTSRSSGRTTSWSATPSSRASSPSATPPARSWSAWA